LRGRKGKSSNSFNAGKQLHRYLVLRSPQEDSAQMAKKIRSQKAKLILRNVPGKLRKRTRQPERLEDRPSLFLYSPKLESAGREVVRVTTCPLSLCPSLPLCLARSL
jgi:hypothetical protein